MSRAIASPVAISPRPERTRSAASLPKNELSSIFAPPCRHRLDADRGGGLRMADASRAGERRVARQRFGNGSGPRARTLRLQLGDAATVDRGHDEAKALDVDGVADLRDAAEAAEDHPADRVVWLVGEIEPQPLARVGQRHQAVDEEGAAFLAEERTLAVELVLDLADELLDDVLEGDEAGGAAELVDHDRELHPLAAELGERAVEVGRLGEVERLAHQLAD